MTSLFDNTPSVLFPATESAPEPSSSHDVEQMIEQLMAQGYGADESAEAVLRYINAQKAAQHSANGSAMKLRSDKERIEYMQQLRAKVAPNVWIPPQMQAEYESEQRVAASQEAFKQRMRERSTAQGPMRSTQAAIEFFQKKP